MGFNTVNQLHVNESKRHELIDARKSGTALIWAVFLFSIFVNLLMLTGPLFMLQVYDRVLGSRSEETLAALFVLVGFLYFFMGLLDYARGRIMARYGANFQTSLDRTIFEARLSRIPDGSQSKGAELKDLESIQTLTASPVFLALFDLPWSPLFLFAIFVLHPMLGWTACAGGAVLVVIAVLNQFLTVRKTQRANVTSFQAQSLAAQAEHARDVVQSQGMRHAVSERWHKKQSAALDDRINAADWVGSFTTSSKAFRLFLQSAILAVGAYFVLQGELTGGAMIAASILLGRALAPIEQCLGQWQVFQRSRQAWSSLDALLSATPKAKPLTALPRPKAQILVRKLVVVPPGGSAPTLKNLNFGVNPGHALGVIGRSGSGKSSLAKALLGIWPSASGEIRLGGAELDQYDPDKLGQYIGYLPQSVALLPGTVAENIARMSANVDGDAVVAAAKRANAHDMILTLPNGYDTQLDGDQSHLSGGQKQRVALARALFGDPVILILDEPNSALDAEGSQALNQTIREFKTEGKAVIIMSHRPQAIAECDTLLVLDQGTVVSFGPRDEVMKAQLKNADQIKRNLNAQAVAK
ncbi:Type I secretion system ATP-binding protein PrsD [Falsiruegeria mediterranea M17]|uniref:Type I secretion system ATP-binding protein PrsD n=1 Tax=Falsiruegeria mediterranea M17 TaxID=1200281 RepID=A0A2R8CFT3_9RHOB|nr:Type I secretion system ATP-binding protein PrsD [Falsiruegeria mediterranea M17]